MNFFESQDTAKRNTGKLVVLFAFAVLSLIVVTNLLVMIIFGFVGTETTGIDTSSALQFDWHTFLLVGAAITGVIVLSSLYKIATLSGGGARIAEMMNGKLLLSGSGDLHERRVLNVVEEMAIASGTPVPPVYLIEEAGINAFAAGFSPSDAVIGVTRGTIQTLSREQLQGVIAHEFSHILHGDMRINIRLMGVLHGIMVLGIIGFLLMRGGAFSRRSKESGGIVFLGLGLIVVGFVGTFFGNLIKAAVSRQREFLADASAVQFTRNPNGIAGALMQIGNHSSRSYIDNPNGAEISHTLFGAGKASALSGLTATHPPLEKRIAAILPGWTGSYDLIKSSRSEADAEPDKKKPEAATAKEKSTAILTGVTGVLITDAIINQVGNPSAEHLRYANSLMQKIPQPLLDAAHEPSAARAIVYFMVLNEAGPIRQEQLSFLEQGADVGVYAELQRLIAAVDSVQVEFRLPLITLSLSSLRQLSKNQYSLFKENFHALIAVDKKINLFEWASQKIVFHHLDIVFEKAHKPKMGNRDLEQSQKSCVLLISVLAHSNRQEGISAAEAFATGIEKLPFSGTLQAASSISFEALDAALDDLMLLKPLQKPALLNACAACITADQAVVPIEAELLRAISAILDCPMPPLLS